MTLVLPANTKRNHCSVVELGFYELKESEAFLSTGLVLRVGHSRKNLGGPWLLGAG